MKLAPAIKQIVVDSAKEMTVQFLHPLKSSAAFRLSISEISNPGYIADGYMKVYSMPPNANTIVESSENGIKLSVVEFPLTVNLG